MFALWFQSVLGEVPRFLPINEAGRGVVLALRVEAAWGFVNSEEGEEEWKQSYRFLFN